jgi:hypothetical protein
MASKKKFYQCSLSDGSDLGTHPGPSAKAVAETLSQTVSSSLEVKAVSTTSKEEAVSKGKLEPSKDPVYIVYLSDHDLFITTPEFEPKAKEKWSKGRDLEANYDRKVVYSPDLHIDLRPVLWAEDVVND